MASAVSPMLAVKAGNRAELKVAAKVDPVLVALTKWNTELVLSGPPPAGAAEPLADRTPYVVDGQPRPFCRPDVRVARRRGFQPGPEVRFEQRADGMHLLVTFEEDPAERAPGAVPFDVKVSGITLKYGRSAGDVLVFANPLQEPLDSGEGPAFRIEADAIVPDDRTARIAAALQSTDVAGWTVRLEFQWLKIIPPPPPPPAPPRPPGGVVVGGPVRPGPIGGGGGVKTQVMVVRDDVAVRPSTSRAAAIDARTSILGASRPDRLTNILVVKPLPPVPQPTQQLLTIVLDRDVRADFPKTTVENRAIYAALDGDYAQAGWRNTVHGWFQPTPIQDTVYCLPHAYRLQVDEVTGLPSIRAVLLRKNELGEIGDTLDPRNFRIRLTLKARPDFDADRLNSLRALIRAESQNTVKFADLVLGGYSAARFVPDSALAGLGELFAGTTAGSQDSFVPSEGFTLTYEGNAEFADLLFQRLEGEGIEGIVEFDLKQPGGTTEKQSVPVVLTLRGLAPLPLPWTFVVPQAPPQTSVATPTDLLPRAITLRNATTRPITLGGLHAHALQKSPVTGRVDDWFQAQPDGSWPRTIPAGGTDTVSLTLEDGKALFNAWDIALVDSRTVASGELVLSQLFDAGSVGVRGWKVDIDCPPMQFFDRLTPQEQAQMADIVGLEVEVRRLGSTAVEEVRLTKQVPAGAVLLSRTVADFISDRATGRSTFEYRTRALRLTRADGWGDWKPETGSALSVFLN